VGDDEAAVGQVALKPLRGEGEQQAVTPEALVELLADRLYGE
jgi:histidyl-tRNA synthetase